jgi:hypothetical protein
MIGRASVLSVGLVVAAGIAQARAQAVLLRMTPPVGQITHYRSVTESWMQIPGMPAGDSTQPTMTQTMFTTRTVTGMEGAARIITTVVDSSRQEMPGMGGMGGMMGGDMLRGMTTTQHVDERGNVLSFDVTPPPGAPPMLAEALRRSGGMGARSSAVMPERAVRPGETWIDSVTTSVGTGPQRQQAVFHVTYTLERVEHQGGMSVAVVSLRGSVHADSAGAPGVAGTMTGELAVDLDAGRLIRSITSMDMTAPTPQGSVPVRSKNTTQALP